MKKTGVIFLFHLSCWVLKAQDNISYGPRAAISIIPVSKSESLGRNFQLGINTGGYFDLKINNRFSLRTELNYALKRQAGENNDTASLVEVLSPLLGLDSVNIPLPDGINLNVYSNTQSAVIMHHIEVPLMGVLHLQRVKISAGPYIGVLVAAKTNTVLQQDIPVLSLIDIDALADLLGDQGQFLPFLLNQFFPGFTKPDTDEIKSTQGLCRIDAGIITDVSYQLENNFSFGIRFQQGFLDYRAHTTGVKKLNTSLQFQIAYRFGKGKNEGPITRVRKNTGED
jgi:hypothetical protein